MSGCRRPARPDAWGCLTTRRSSASLSGKRDRVRINAPALAHRCFGRKLPPSTRGCHSSDASKREQHTQNGEARHVDCQTERTAQQCTLDLMPRGPLVNDGGRMSPLMSPLVSTVGHCVTVGHCDDLAVTVGHCVLQLQNHVLWHLHPVPERTARHVDRWRS